MSDAEFINVSNGRVYKRKGKRRYHLVSCTYCLRKFKLLKVHYKMYHPGILQLFNEKARAALRKGVIGEISGVRFIRT